MRIENDNSQINFKFNKYFFFQWFSYSFLYSRGVNEIKMNGIFSFKGWDYLRSVQGATNSGEKVWQNILSDVCVNQMVFLDFEILLTIVNLLLF